MFINYLEKTKQNLRKNKFFVKKRLKLKNQLKYKIHHKYLFNLIQIKSFFFACNRQLFLKDFF